jgi:hypothetical protein
VNHCAHRGCGDGGLHAKIVNYAAEGGQARRPGRAQAGGGVQYNLAAFQAPSKRAAGGVHKEAPFGIYHPSPRSAEVGLHKQLDAVGRAAARPREWNASPNPPCALHPHVTGRANCPPIAADRRRRGNVRASEVGCVRRGPRANGRGISEVENAIPLGGTGGCKKQREEGQPGTAKCTGGMHRIVSVPIVHPSYCKVIAGHKSGALVHFPASKGPARGAHALRGEDGGSRKSAAGFARLPRCLAGAREIKDRHDAPRADLRNRALRAHRLRQRCRRPSELSSEGKRRAVRREARGPVAIIWAAVARKARRAQGAPGVIQLEG